MDIDIICIDCVHLFRNKKLQCSAFPNGIPEDIIIGTNIHETPTANQKNNIVYKQIETDENTPLKKVGGPSKGIEPYKISTDSKDYRPKKKILKSAARVG